MQDKSTDLSRWVVELRARNGGEVRYTVRCRSKTTAVAHARGLANEDYPGRPWAWPLVSAREQSE